MKTGIIAKSLEISGVVQGVGFRPFLFVLARKYDLKGEVSNTSEGVLALVEGRLENIENFINDIYHKNPLLASVSSINAVDAPLQNFSLFQIVKSHASKTRTALISPDVGLCEDCLFEMKDPGDRRYEYPFINCTNCGPRYSIIEDIPYDRPKTSMKKFKMCPLCQREYDDPMDRRFHAQPNACPDCGPQVFLTDNRGKKIETGSDQAILVAARYLNQGKIVAVKGLGGFHLACNAADQEAVEKLRQRKLRPHKPFALMAASPSILSDHVLVNAEENQLLESYHRPIVLLQKKRTPFAENCCLAADIAPLNTCLGIMLAYTPLHYLLLDKGPDVLVMTSGNLSGEPLAIDNEDALKAFAHIADYFLLHNRDIYFRADDSIVRFQAGKSRFLRRSRGYAPLPISLKKKMPKILACGGGLKSTVCLTRDKYAFLSQHIGDLDNVKVYDFFKDSIHHLKEILDIQPDIIAHDMHPGYMSTGYAMSLKGIKKIAVQHHHAHAVSCMAENDLDGEVIGLTLDGTGYGTDGHIWGGEILICTKKNFKRKVHLSYIRMPGGDAAVLEPWRMAASVLYQVFGSKFLNLDIPFIRQMEKEKLSFVCQMMEKNVNSPLTSSVGRLFDAVSSLLCIRHEISYESQAAMELEAMADKNILKDVYEFKLGKDQIDMMPCIRQIIEDIKKNISVGRISSKFHQTLVAGFCQAVAELGIQTGIRQVVLSGGVFNNDIILNAMTAALEENKLKVYTHTKVPAGDGGISLGQAVVAAEQ